mgnify:CR=1 FL=1|jgi:hypothetical protein
MYNATVHCSINGQQNSKIAQKSNKHIYDILKFQHYKLGMVIAI